jgi:uncharacterized LabA/DUF88 family protein
MATAMATQGTGELTINSVVLGTVYMYHEKLPKPDVIEIIETNFEEGEIFSALTVLHGALGMDPPHGRQTSSNRTAVTAYANDAFDTISKLVSESKLPRIVVSSEDLARLPLSKKKMDNAEVATVNCRLEALESMIKDVVSKVNTLTDKPIFSNVTPTVVVGGPTQQGVPGAVVGTGARPRPGQGQGPAGPVGQNMFRDRSPSVKRGYSEVAKDNLENPAGGKEFQTVNNRRRPRKMNYGTNKIEEAGAEAAPVDVFVGNTNPRATEEIIKRVLIKCAEKMPDKPKLEIIEVKLLTNAERDPNPRFKSWMVRVPYSFKTLMEDDAFYPDGWSHRKYFPKRLQQDRNVRQHLDPNDPVNMELAHGANTSA